MSTSQQQRPALVDQPASGPFAGLKVADFTWAAAGPIITKQLADLGAMVVRVESTKHPDSVRFGGPFKDDIPGLKSSGFFADFNTSKRSLALNMANPAAHDVARRLISWSDVVTETFTPRVMRQWGLAYEQISQERPDLIMLSSCLQGATGPYREYAGYGGQGGALAGIHYLTGWPDREPAGPKGAYTDTIVPRFGVALLAAALIHRRNTGRGQHIDLAQIEAALQFLAPEIADYSVTGRVAERRGNRSWTSVPCGSFPCAGTDRWVAIEVRDDDEWQRLTKVMGSPPWATDLDLATVAGRRGHEDEIEAAIAAWTAGLDAREAMQLLLEAGIPAGLVQDAKDLFEDPQLEARGHFVALEHPEMGSARYNGPAHRFSRTPARLRSSAPLLGEHTHDVMHMLGYSEADVERMVQDDILV